MAVQQNKKSPSKRGMHRAHDFLTNPPLAVEPTTGEVHLRHHISPNGYYHGPGGVAFLDAQPSPRKATDEIPEHRRDLLKQRASRIVAVLCGVEAVDLLHHPEC